MGTLHLTPISLILSLSKDERSPLFVIPRKAGTHGGVRTK